MQSHTRTTTEPEERRNPMPRNLQSSCAILYFIVFFGFAFATLAQSPLDQDWTTWSTDVCMKILTASPWVTTAQPQDPKDIRRAVLLSSLLVREAMLRQEQIRQKYDTMSPKKRREFDEQTTTCLTDAKYSNYIVLRVWGGPPVNPNGSDDPGQLSVSDRVKLSPSDNYDSALACGGDNFPWQYIPTAIDRFNDDYNRQHPSPVSPVRRENNQFARIRAKDFLYPRSIGGNPLFQRGDRTMVFNWGEKGGQFSFELANLIYKDKLDF
jgi:hypothetical protein